MNQAVHQLLQLILQGVTWVVRTLETLWTWSWAQIIAAFNMSWANLPAWKVIVAVVAILLLVAMMVVLFQRAMCAFSEIAAAFWDYPGQVLRSFALDEPTPLYRDLHAAADAAFDAIAAVLRDGVLPAQAIEAARVIEDAGFTTIDDLLHGYGGGYLPPILGSASRPAGPVPDEPFRAGMTVVIQPNVVTKDGKAGVQTGEMVLITETGIERMHAMPRRFVQLG